ncbi:hypothetical protein J6590_039633 [Homalodisca vitripennis]|nr:hypothetical protein J6590_039633 [Homalodisca vitripennis]
MDENVDPLFKPYQNFNYQKKVLSGYCISRECPMNAQARRPWHPSLGPPHCVTALLTLPCRSVVWYDFILLIVLSSIFGKTFITLLPLTAILLLEDETEI